MTKEADGRAKSFEKRRVHGSDVSREYRGELSMNDGRRIFPRFELQDRPLPCEMRAGGGSNFLCHIRWCACECESTQATVEGVQGQKNLSARADLHHRNEQRTTFSPWTMTTRTPLVVHLLFSKPDVILSINKSVSNQPSRRIELCVHRTVVVVRGAEKTQALDPCGTIPRATLPVNRHTGTCCWASLSSGGDIQSFQPDICLHCGGIAL